MNLKFKIQNSKFLISSILLPVFLFGFAPIYSQAFSNSQVEAFTITTNDPYFTTDFLQEDKQWYLEKTKIPEAWDFSKGSGAVTVAIIDTGIHASHIELNDGRVVAGFNTVTNENIPSNSDSDDNGHGTAVAGIIGGIQNNAKGIAGINWNIKIMPIKSLLADGTGNIASVSAGIIWAADHGANIINLSLGGQGFGADKTLVDSITYAYNRGVLIVAAAGNDLAENGLNLDHQPVYPICADNGLNMVLGVAATDINDRKANFSNFGSSCVDISAPGKRILTSAYLPSTPSNNVLIYGSGTSLAAPIVSGIAALIKASNSNLSNVEIRDILIRTADNIDSLNLSSCAFASCQGLIGKGRVNAYSYFAPKPVANGSLLRDTSTNTLYIVLNGIKKPISTFVFNQRGFDSAVITDATEAQLESFVTGPPLLPLEGTLLKSVNNPTVYIVTGDVKRPLTYLVFLSRHFNFAEVLTLSDTEVDFYPTGDWYWPPDGTQVLVQGDSTVFVMDRQVRRPTTFFVFTQRKLSFKNVIAVSADEFSHVPAPTDNFWLAPLDGTLVKSFSDPAIYIIENSMKRLLSFNAFVTRGFSFRNVKSLPQVEIDVIAAGGPIL